VLLSIWADVGEHMRRLLEESTLADVAAITRGESPWPAAVTADR
jgi:DNA-binding IscR family transcriptional regulator